MSVRSENGFPMENVTHVMSSSGYSVSELFTFSVLYLVRHFNNPVS